MTSFRFIHAADIHLDSPLRGLSRHEGSAVDRLRSATRAAFENLVTFAIDEEVAFVVIAGDLYDGDWRDFQTGLFFSYQMGRLAEVGIKAFVLHGNHDAESQITKRLTLPDNVSIFHTRKAESFVLEDHRAVLHGQSFRQRDISDNLVPAYPDPVDGFFNIGVLHTALTGSADHALYAPCSLEELVNKGYDYWALGHVHQAQVLHERPYVVFPGNLQGRHIRETGPKGACLITVEDRQVTGFSRLPLDVVRWERLFVDVEACSRKGDVIDRMREAIEQAVAGADGRLLACRLELTGRTPLFDEVVSSSSQLIAEAKAAALAMGDEAAWVEKVVFSVEPILDPQVIALRKDALGELHNMLGDVKDDVDIRQLLEADISQLLGKLPHDVKKETEDEWLRSALTSDYESLLTRASQYLTARLTTEGE